MLNKSPFLLGKESDQLFVVTPEANGAQIPFAARCSPGGRQPKVRIAVGQTQHVYSCLTNPTAGRHHHLPHVVACRSPKSAAHMRCCCERADS